MLRKMKKYMFNRKYRFAVNSDIFHLYDMLSDKEYIKRKYNSVFAKGIDFKQVSTFNEKLQFLKLYDRNEQYTIMADKYEAKKMVAKIIGSEHIIPTIGVWDDPEGIDFGSLPNRFVLKCNHNSGLGMCICKDKQTLDTDKVKKDLKRGLRQNYYLNGREWPYKNIKRKIIAEDFLSDESGQLIDYKVHCFNGDPRFILVCKDRFKKTGLTEDFFSTKWEHLDVKRPDIPNSTEVIPKPDELEEILEFSKKLSDGIPFVRTDFYIVNHHVYFSELTFFPASGFALFEPDEWDYIFGNYLKLPIE